MKKLYPEGHNFGEDIEVVSTEGKDLDTARRIIQLSVGPCDKALTEEQLVRLVMGYTSLETKKTNGLGKLAYEVTQLRKRIPLAMEEQRIVLNKKINDLQNRISVKKPPAPILEQKGEDWIFTNKEEIVHRVTRGMDTSSHEKVRSLRRKDVEMLVKDEMIRRDTTYIRPSTEDDVPLDGGLEVVDGRG